MTQSEHQGVKSAMVESTKVAYSVTEAAELLSLGRTLVFSLIKSGELGSMKVGHRRLVTYEDLQAFVHQRRKEAA